MSTSDPRRQALVESLRSRYQQAEQANDAQAKQALFKEAVYLNILPELLDPERPETSPINVSDG